MRIKHFAFAALLLLLAACQTAGDGSGTVGSGSTTPLSPAQLQAAKQAFDQLKSNGVGDRVFFDYNSSDLTAEAQDTLDKQVSWMKRFGCVPIVVEGHADERGTREYNLALGERRANTVKKYMGRMGVNPGCVSTISYGKERPAVTGSNEAAWAQNRRGVTVISE